MDTAERLSNQMVRDLYWIFSSPPLIESNQFSFQKKTLSESWPTAIGQAPLKINSFMADKNLKMLGPYFEALWEFYLLNCPGKNLVAKNVQVFSNNKTIGEFDFIYRDESAGEYRHLEVAIKYYLGLNDKTGKTITAIEEGINLSNQFSPMNQWIGPNANDRLDKKYSKMLKQQSKLSKTPEGKATLGAFGVLNSSEEIRSEICLLGYLFYPLEGEGTGEPMRPPENSHPSHNKGYWLKLSHLDRLLPEGAGWKIMDKPFWLAPLLELRQQLKTRAELIESIQNHFYESLRPLLVSSFIESENKNDVVFESDKKYFVVPDSWPEKKTD